MRYINGFLVAVITTSLLSSACNSVPEQQQTAVSDPYANNAVLPDEDYWAKENFDLEHVGDLLEESDSPEEFERYLNQRDGINNLDLNGDGYADYISVDEFEDRDSNSRGLSLFTRFGPDIIQEVARIFFYRDRPDYPGSRVLLYGNDEIYGDNQYYETNWLDRALPLVSYLFSDRDQYYRSPYYYDNYPPDYVRYEIVDQPYYVSRIDRLYSQPVFVYTAAPPAYFSNIKIKSPHQGKWMEKIHAKFVKPRKEQADFFKNNPARRQFAKGKDAVIDGKPGRPDPPRSDRGDERGNPARDERGAERGNPDKPAAKPDVKPAKPDNPKADKPDNPGKGQGQGQQGPPKGQGQGGGQGKGQGGGQGKGKKP
jgi:hypothetical protein